MRIRRWLRITRVDYSRAVILAVRSVLMAVVLCWPQASAAQAAAQASGNSPDCKDASTTAAMRTCENARYEKAQQDLNAALSALMRQLDDNQKAKLRVAENAWLRFREANADFEAAAAGGGTLAPLLRISTLAGMTEARAAELKKALQQ